jgi:hypothetical protein
MAICRKPDGTLVTVAGTSCPAGTTPVGSPQAPQGGGDVQAAAPTPASKRPIRVPGVTAVSVAGVEYNGQQYYSSPRQTYAYYDNSDQAKFQSWDALPSNMKAAVQWYAEQMGRGKTAMGLWDDALAATKQDSAMPHGSPSISPFGWITQFAGSMGISLREGTGPGAGGGGYGGGGGGGGGAAAPMPAGRDAIKRAMDTMAMDLIGRSLSEDEVDRYYSRYVKEFSGNPNMDMQASGIDALQSNVDYQEYQVAQKFASAFGSVLRGSA